MFGAEGALPEVALIFGTVARPSLQGLMRMELKEMQEGRGGVKELLWTACVGGGGGPWASF